MSFVNPIDSDLPVTDLPKDFCALAGCLVENRLNFSMTKCNYGFNMYAWKRK